MQVRLLHGEPRGYSSLPGFHRPPSIVKINNVLADPACDCQGGPTAAGAPETEHDGLCRLWNDSRYLFLDPTYEAPKFLIIVRELNLLSTLSSEEPTLSPTLQSVFALKLLPYPLTSGNS